MTVPLYGANRPKLVMITASQKTSTTKNGVGPNDRDKRTLDREKISTSKRFNFSSQMQMRRFTQLRDCLRQKA